MNAQKGKEREVQECFVWAKDMRLEENSNGKKKQIRMDPWRCPFLLRHVLVIGDRMLPFALRNPCKD